MTESKVEPDTHILIVSQQQFLDESQTDLDVFSTPIVDIAPACDDGMMALYFDPEEELNDSPN